MIELNATALLVGVLACVGTLLAAWITTRSQRRQAKEGLVVTREQGAATLLDALARNLNAENERLERIIERRNKRVRDLEAEVDDLREQLDGLRSRSGTRRTD